MNYYLYFLMLFCSALLYSQEKIKGRALNDNIGISNMYVINEGNKEKTMSDADGFFEILASNKDTILFLKEGYEPKSVRLDNNTDNRVEIVTKVREIKEIILKFAPTNNLASDLKRMPKNLKINDLNLSLDKSMRDNRYVVLPNAPILKTPKMFDNHPNVPGFNIIAVLGFIKNLIIKPRKNPNVTLSKNEKERFLLKMEKAVDANLLKELNLQEYELLHFIQFADNQQKMTNLLYYNWDLLVLEKNLRLAIVKYKLLNEKKVN